MFFKILPEIKQSCNAPSVLPGVPGKIKKYPQFLPEIKQSCNALSVFARGLGQS